METISNLLHSLATKYGMSVNVNSKAAPDNQSFIAGNDEIYLGKYQEPELALISFFHELGHAKQSEEYKLNNGTLLCELDCWRIGIELAKENGILFSDAAISWGYKQALSYTGRDEREHMYWKVDVAPSLWINKVNL